MRATVVVVNWNGAHLLPACLEALRRQTVIDAHVWVVDNASSDGSRELLARDFPEVRVLANPDNRGFAGGNNTALVEVTTPYAVLLNNDARPEPTWLEHLLVALEADDRLAAVTSKVVFAPRFLPLQLATTGFSPGVHDPRELGLRIASMSVDGDDVTERVLWERMTFGPEGEGAARFRWTRPAGELLLPVEGDRDHEVVVRWAAETTKDAELAGTILPVTACLTEVTVTVPAGTPTVDVVNNAGSIVFTAGYGADRGFQDVDTGQYDEPVDVFALCGCAVAFRTSAGAAAGWFDEDFFLYYEDTDLSWRLRLGGWDVRYVHRAIVHHEHGASSGIGSPRFRYYNERNRLTTLLKDAPWSLVVPVLLRHPVMSGVRIARGGPERAVGSIRLRAYTGFLRRAPHTLRQRRSMPPAMRARRPEVARLLLGADPSR